MNATVPWCASCNRVVPLAEVHTQSGGKHYIHVVPKPAIKIGFGTKNQRCGAIEWRVRK